MNGGMKHCGTSKGVNSGTIQKQSRRDLIYHTLLPRTPKPLLRLPSVQLQA